MPVLYTTRQKNYQKYRDKELETQMRRYAAMRGYDVEVFIQSWKDKKNHQIDSDKKHCRRCNEIKSRTEFPKNKKLSDGLFSYCRKCKNALDLEIHRRNPEKTRKVSLRSYHKNKERYKERIAKNTRKYQTENPEKVAVNNQKRRSLRNGNGGEFSLKEWLDLCQRYGNLCLCCREAKPLTIDHIVPLSKGGSNNIDNIQPLCKSCNSSKRTKTIDYREVVN